MEESKILVFLKKFFSQILILKITVDTNFIALLRPMSRDCYVDHFDIFFQGYGYKKLMVSHH